MKKIIAGMFFRMIRGFEIWILLALTVICALFFNYKAMDDEMYLYMLHSDETVREDLNGVAQDVNAGNVKQFRFENLGVSVEDAYRARVETIDQATFDRLEDTYNYYDQEIRFLFVSLGSIHLLPTVMIILFIPFFFGRMFSDGTIKNLIAGGHTRGSILFSSMIVTMVLDLIALLINIAAFAVWCVYFEWKPPVYMPVLVPMLILAVLMMFMASSICLSGLFISSKKTVSFVVGFLVALYLAFPSSSMIAMVVLESSYQNYEISQEAIDETKAIVQEKGWNYIEQKFDYSQFTYTYYYGDKELLGINPPSNPLLNKVILGMLYLDPALVSHSVASNHWYAAPYLVSRDGLLTVNTITAVLWLTVSTACGLLIFRRKEIHC